MRFYRRRIFPLLEGGLYVAFLTLDFCQPSDSAPIKFAAICLCAVTALLGANSRDALLVAAAQCLTAHADWYLLLGKGSPLTGVALFVAVQLIYMARIRLLRGQSFAPALCFRAVCLIVGLWVGTREALIGTGLFYFSSLLANTWEAFWLPDPRFASGLLLFVCCDLCVGLWNVNRQMPDPLLEFARVGMWLFYLPAQILIVLSARRKGEPS